MKKFYVVILLVGVLLAQACMAEDDIVFIKDGFGMAEEGDFRQAAIAASRGNKALYLKTILDTGNFIPEGTKGFVVQKGPVDGCTWVTVSLQGKLAVLLTADVFFKKTP